MLVQSDAHFDRGVITLPHVRHDLAERSETETFEAGSGGGVCDDSAAASARADFFAIAEVVLMEALRA